VAQNKVQLGTEWPPFSLLALLELKERTDWMLKLRWWLGLQLTEGLQLALLPLLLWPTTPLEGLRALVELTPDIRRRDLLRPRCSEPDRAPLAAAGDRKFSSFFWLVGWPMLCLATMAWSLILKFLRRAACVIQPRCDVSVAWQRAPEEMLQRRQAGEVRLRCFPDWSRWSTDSLLCSRNICLPTW